MWRLSTDQCEVKDISEAKRKKQRSVKRNTVTHNVDCMEKMVRRRIQENQVSFKCLCKKHLSAKPVAFMLGFF